LTDFVVRLVADGGYPAILLLMALENVFPPLPSEVIMGLAGVEAGQGRLAFWAVILAGTIGSTLGNYVWYWLGRRVGPARIDRLVTRFGRWLTLDRQDVARLSGFFHRHGAIAVLVARLMPGLRTMISLPAGLFAMPPSRFVLWTLIGTTGWNLVIATIGYKLGQVVIGIERYTGPVSSAIIGIMVLIYVIRLIRWRPRGD